MKRIRMGWWMLSLFLWPVFGIWAAARIWLAKPDAQDFGESKYSIGGRLLAVSVIGILLLLCLWQGYWPEWQFSKLSLELLWLLLLGCYAMYCIDGAYMVKNSGLKNLMFCYPDEAEPETENGEN